MWVSGIGELEEAFKYILDNPEADTKSILRKFRVSRSEVKNMVTFIEIKVEGKHG